MSRPLTQDAAAMYLLAAAVALDTCPTELRATAVADRVSETILPALHRPRALEAIAAGPEVAGEGSAEQRRRESARVLASAIRVLLTAAGLEAEDDDYRLAAAVRTVSADTVD